VSCRIEEKILHEFADGELASGERDSIQLHLNECRECRQKLFAMQTVRDKLFEACSAVNAPEDLRRRILIGIDERERRAAFQPRIIDHISSSFRRRPGWLTLAAGAVVVIAALVLIPWRGSIAKELAAQHLKFANSADFEGIHAALPMDVSAFFFDHIGKTVDLPQVLGEDMQLAGGTNIFIRSKPAAQAFYSNGKLRCSLFIGEPEHLEDGSESEIDVLGKKLGFFAVDDLNFICWEKAGLEYIISGCCPVEDLAGLASSEP